VLRPQNCPLHENTKGLFNKELLAKMKKGSWLVNTARGAICVAEDVAEALKSGHLNGYAGDVWSGSPPSNNKCMPQLTSADVQPAPSDHPWRTMKNTQGAPPLI
jgi:formate dehydrogenase